MYKEYRELSRADAVVTCYQDLAAQHRARFHAVHIIKVAEVATKDVQRPYIKQLLQPKLAFPLPHRILKATKQNRVLYAGKRPNTF
jgi:large subunit ribosomal protein L18Ae